MDGGKGSRQALLLAWLHLAVLWTFGMAQPLFNVLAGDPAFFVARGNTSGDILLLAFGMVLVPPTVLVAVEAVFLRSPAVRFAVHVAFVGLLAAVFVLQVLADAAPGGSSALLIPLALAAGAGLAVAYARTRVVPSMLTVLSPAPALFLAFFLLFSDVSKLVLPSDTAVAGTSVGGDTPVVFVILDEFSGVHLQTRGGAINAARFPNLAAFARGSTWYRNATTVTDHTSRAVPAILSAERSSNDKLPVTSDYPNNLFTLLGGDYDLDVHEMASHMCPDSLCEPRRQAAKTRLRSLARDLRIVSLRRLLPDDLAEGLPPVNQTFGSFDGGAEIVSGAVRGTDQTAPQARGRSFEDFTRGIGAENTGKTLHFSHILLPHLPWLYLPTGQQYSENGRAVPGLNSDSDSWEGTAWQPRQGFQRYLLQAEYVDRLIGRLVRRLRRTGLYDRALVVVMADHGVTFRPNSPRRRVTPANFADLASIPLFIKEPGQRRGRVDESPATSVDVLPTVADYLDVKLPWKTDGRSLLEGERPSSIPLRVAPPEGDEVEMAFPAFIRQRDQFVAAFADEFPDQPSLYTGGSHGGVVGRPTSTLRITRRSGARVELDSARSLAAVNPKGAVLPSFVSGLLTGVQVGESLAVAVNGRVVTTAKSFDDRGQIGFTALVPPGAFRPGENEVKVFVLQGSGAGTTLAALGQRTAAGYELVEEDGRRVIRSSSGEEARIQDHAVEGNLEGVDLLPGGVVVRGWAAVPNEAGAERILVYVDGRLVAEGPPTIDRADVVKAVGAGTLKSGFELSGNDPRDGTRSRSDVQVFAIRGDRASEIR